MDAVYNIYYITNILVAKFLQNKHFTYSVFRNHYLTSSGVELKAEVGIFILPGSPAGSCNLLVAFFLSFFFFLIHVYFSYTRF